MWWENLIVYICVAISIAYFVYVLIKKLKTPKCDMNCDKCPYSSDNLKDDADTKEYSDELCNHCS